MSAAAARTARPVTEVAVGVLIRADGAVLLADRPAGKPYAGYWEFPGGKIEAGETVEQALARELAEELGLAIHGSIPWVVMEYDYPHAYVRLNFRRVHAWTGTPMPVEGQQLRFLMPGDAPPAPLLPAAVPALRWIQLPTVTGSSPQTTRSSDEAVAWLEAVLARGLRQILWREPLLPEKERARALTRSILLVRGYGARLLLGTGDLGVAAASFPGGLPEEIACLLGQSELRGTHTRPGTAWLAAVVASEADLKLAVAVGCDFAVQAPIDGGPAGSAPDSNGIGSNFPLPFYLMGNLDLPDLRAAQTRGGHGLITLVPATAA